ncbi:MAG TPA: hypothetical protein VG982_02675 [Candidatus Paceibacterota bacterium]|jgi:hypothetical protein|nr:hypothetical protein [Candidatus Paceibacterota bacterium]
MKKPLLLALVAAVYIVVIVLAAQNFTFVVPKETIIAPIAMLGLLVFSAAIMGFLFLSEPLRLFMENRQREAVLFFAKTVGCFACFVVLFIVALFLL